MIFAIITLAARPLCRLPYRKAAESALGEHYDLEVIAAASSIMKTINKTYRGKETSANVLSFSLGPKAGQLFLDPAVIAKEATMLGVSEKAHAWNIYLHGLLHLKGFRHGARMERALKRLSRFCMGRNRKAISNPRVGSGALKAGTANRDIGEGWKLLFVPSSKV